MISCLLTRQPYFFSLKDNSSPTKWIVISCLGVFTIATIDFVASFHVFIFTVRRTLGQMKRNKYIRNEYCIVQTLRIRSVTTVLVMSRNFRCDLLLDKILLHALNAYVQCITVKPKDLFPCGFSTRFLLCEDSKF